MQSRFFPDSDASRFGFIGIVAALLMLSLPATVVFAHDEETMLMEETMFMEETTLMRQEKPGAVDKPTGVRPNSIPEAEALVDTGGPSLLSLVGISLAISVVSTAILSRGLRR